MSVEIQVEDTGIGLTGQDCERTFERFSQVDESSARRFGGTGLGLAITRQLVQLMGGTVSVESRPDEGSVFRVCLDLRQQGAAVVSDAHRYLGVKVLISEPHTATRRALRLQLEDCQLPMMDGYETTRRWRAMESVGSLSRIPIIALTAHAMQGDREKALESGMDDYLSKPYTLSQLRALIELWSADHTGRAAS